MEFVFFDFNGDGTEEALVVTPDGKHDKSYVWEFVRKGGSGVTEMKVLEGGRKAFLSCPPWSLCAVKFQGMNEFMIGIEVMCGVFDCQSNCVNSVKNFYLRKGPQQELVIHSLRNGLGNIFRNPGFDYLSSVEVDRYEGFDLKHVNVNTNFWQIVPPVHKALYGGARKPLGFDTFVRRYRANVTRRVGATRPVVVKAVFLDADNDGQTDFYVTSDAEREGAENFRWHLYLNRQGEFSPAVGRVWINRDVRYLVGVLDPVVVAPMNSFFRVALYACDHECRLYFKPVFLVVDNVKGEMVNRAYRDLVPMEIQAKRPVVRNGQDRDGWRRFDRWKDEAEKKLGFVPPPRTLTDFVKEDVFYRLERLPCQEFHEDQ